MDTSGLGKVDLFDGLAQSDLDLLAAAAALRRVEAGGYFFYQDDPAERLYVLTEGSVKLMQVTVDGQQVILRVVGAWAQFGGLAFVPGIPYPASAQASEDSAAISWGQAQLHDLSARISRLGLNAMRMMASHVRDTQDRFTELATERVERRLARTLLRLAKQLGKKSSAGIEIGMALSRQDLAEMSGTTLFSVSRILSEWERQGMISAGRERVVILRPHDLVRTAEDLPDADHR